MQPRESVANIIIFELIGIRMVGIIKKKNIISTIFVILDILNSLSEFRF